MFYISRRIGATRYGVVDTEDGREDIMTFDEVRKAVCEYGVNIVGVTKRRRGTYFVVDKIEVYVPDSRRSTNENKLRFMSGVNVKAQDGVIVDVDWKSPDINTPERVVRLSDYGTSCGPTILSQRTVKDGMLRHVADQKLTIVLDDKIKTVRKTFKGCYGTGLVFDLREVTNKQTADWFYADLGVGASISQVRRTVIDREDRLVPFISLLIFEFSNFDECASYVPDRAEAERLVTQKYLKQLVKVPSKFDYTLTQDMYFDAFANQYCRWLRDHYNEVMSADFDVVWNNYMNIHYGRYSNLYSCILRGFVGGESAGYRRLRRYLTLNNPAPEAKDAFLQIFRKINEVFIEYGTLKHWC